MAGGGDVAADTSLLLMPAVSKIQQGPPADGDPDPPVKVQPRTVLMRQGLDQVPPEPYFVHEEEVSRAGTRVMQAYQRTRATDGRVYTWLRVRRQTGRGEGSSGLAFDQLTSSTL